MTEHGKTEDSTTQHSTTGPQSGPDKFFAALRGIGVRRRTDDKWIAGVCSGLADRLGVDPVIVRGALVVLTLLGGVGVTIYLVAWALLPNDKNEIAAQRALRDGHGGSIVLIIIAALALLGGSWWSSGSGWGFPWALVITGALIWWLIKRSPNRPDADQQVSSPQPGSAFGTGTSQTAFAAGASQTAFAAGTSQTTAGPAPTTYVPSPSGSSAAPTTYDNPAPRKLRRRSGGPLMALVAIGLALVTFGSLNWLGNEYAWAGSHAVIAMAGSLAAIGLLLVGLGVAGWRAGFVSFLAIVLAISAFSISVVPSGIHLNGRVGDQTWKPTSVTSTSDYQLGAGNGILDLRGLPSEGLSEAKLPAYVGLGELKVIVPADLTVKVVGHVGLGNIQLGDDRSDDQGGSDVDRTIVVGDGPTEVVVDAGVGVGQLTVVKE